MCYIKNNFLKIKNIYFNLFLNKKYFKKQPLTHSQIPIISFQYRGLN